MKNKSKAEYLASAETSPIVWGLKWHAGANLAEYVVTIGKNEAAIAGQTRWRRHYASTVDWEITHAAGVNCPCEELAKLDSSLWGQPVIPKPELHWHLSELMDPLEVVLVEQTLVTALEKTLERLEKSLTLVRREMVLSATPEEAHRRGLQSAKSAVKAFELAMKDWPGIRE